MCFPIQIATQKSDCQFLRQIFENLLNHIFHSRKENPNIGCFLVICKRLQTDNWLYLGVVINHIIDEKLFIFYFNYSAYIFML